MKYVQTQKWNIKRRARRKESETTGNDMTSLDTTARLLDGDRRGNVGRDGEREGRIELSNDIGKGSG